MAPENYIALILSLICLSSKTELAKGLKGALHNFFKLYFLVFILFIYLFIFYCSGFCHTLKWNSHEFTCVPHPDPPSHLPLHPIPLGLPTVPGPSACLMHPTWAGDLFHPRQHTCFDAVLLKQPTLAFSHRVQKTVLYICVSFSVLHIGLSWTSF